MATAKAWLSILVSLAGCTAACGQGTVSLAWDASPETNVVGYFIYFGMESGVYSNRTEVGNTNTCTVGGLTKGVTYYFVVTATAADGLESDPSNEVAYLVPGVMQVLLQRVGTTFPSISFPIAPGQRCELQASSDLVSWLPIWITLGTTNQWVQFEDREAAGLPQRFYRVVHW